MQESIVVLSHRPMSWGRAALFGLDVRPRNGVAFTPWAFTGFLRADRFGQPLLAPSPAEL